MNQTCSVHEGEEKPIQNYCQKTSLEDTTWKPRHSYEDCIRIDLYKMRCNGVYWI